MMDTPRFRIFLAFVALGAVVLLQVPAVSQNASSKAAPDVPRLPFEKYTLPNGLDVILSEDRSLPLVAVNLWYHVGPANEEPGRTGFAHLFEHMMFQGSRHVPPDTHFRFLEAAGATGVNGTTDLDRTNYFETLPANQLELGLWLESDRMGYLLDVLDAAQLGNQQDVVRNERRQSVENVPYGISEEALMQTVFPAGHPYYANVIGSHEDIQSARLDDVKRFFRQYYTPNNASLAIVGDFDNAQTKALVKKYFGSLKRGPAPPAIKATAPRITEERRSIVKDRVELPRVYLAWITPPIFKPGDADADVAAGILAGGRSSRLFRKLVYERQIAQSVTARQQSLMLGSVFQIQATARPGHSPEELERALDEELDRLRASGPDAAEVERSRNSIETRIVERLERRGGFGGRADRLNQYNHFLGTPDYLQKDFDRYRAVTPASVRAFVDGYLTRSARVVVHAVAGQPDLRTVPTPASKTAEREGAESVNADEPWRNTPPKAGPPRPLQVATPESVRLSNGLTVMLSRRSGFPLVAADLTFRTGSDANPIDKAGLAAFTVAMLDQGTASRSAVQIAESVAQLGASLSASTSMDASFVRVQSLRKNFSRALDIVADIALHASFPAVEVERQRASRLTQLVQQRESASALASNVMASVLYGSRHPYGSSELGTDASVKAISRSDMESFWKRSFVPNNAALVVVGDITMRELRPLVEKSFGSWVKGMPPQPSIGSPEPANARLVIVDKPGAPQTQLRVATIGARRSTPDYRSIQVMNLALGGLFSSRIYHDLREEKGYTYGASSQFAFRREAGPYAVATGVRTEVTAPAVAAIFEQLRGLFTRPLTDEEVAMARNALAQSLPGSFETSPGAASSFSNAFIYDLGIDYYANFAKDVQAVTREQAQAAGEQYVKPDAFVVIAVGDRARIQPELEKLNLGPIEIRSANDVR